MWGTTHSIWPGITDQWVQWNWTEVTSLLHTIKSHCHFRINENKDIKTQCKDQQQCGEVWLLPGFPPSAFLWPGATEQCVCDEHEGASSSSVRQGPPCHWHGTSKPAAVTLHHYQHTSLVRTPRRGRHTEKQGANTKKKRRSRIGLIGWDWNCRRWEPSSA